MSEQVQGRRADGTEKRTYSAPKLQSWGTVAEITKTGLTHPGADAKAGSVLSKGK